MKKGYYFLHFIFSNMIDQECKVQTDPFHPLELDQKDKKYLTGAPAKATVKL